jgi:hypothetical protein
MDMQALLIFQIVADVVLCIAIVFLLTRIGRNIGQARAPLGDEQYLAELGLLIKESHAEAEHFSRTLDESCAKFKDLAVHLEEQEARLALRLQEVNRQLKGGQSPDKTPDKAPGQTPDQEAGSKYANIIALLKTGLTVKEAARQSGSTEGEVALIFELEKKKTES